MVFINVQLIAHTPEPERVIAAAAKLCYSQSSATDLFDGLTNEEAARFVKMLADLGHESPLEHVSFTFAVEGISRSCLAQLTRHRIASYSVQSQRYVNMEDAGFVTPPAIEENPEAGNYYQMALFTAKNAYRLIHSSLVDQHTRRLMDEYGMSETTAQKKAEKLANEDARFILPNACTTNLVMTFNARSLINFFGLRCCNRAQWEIRELATKIYALVYNLAPNVFGNAGPSCVVTGKCSEGSMSCGKKPEVQELFNSIRTGG